MPESRISALTLVVTAIFALSMIAVFTGQITVSIVGWLALVVGWLWLHYNYPNDRPENNNRSRM